MVQSFLGRKRQSRCQQSADEGVEHPGEGPGQLDRCAQHRKRNAIFASNCDRLMFILIGQDDKVPLVEDAILIGEGTLQHDGRLGTPVGMCRRLASRNQFLQNHLLYQMLLSM